jgi:hypothetical protein
MGWIWILSRFQSETLGFFSMWIGFGFYKDFKSSANGGICFLQGDWIWIL